MPRWTDKSEYKRLSGEIAVSEGRDFERRILPLIRLIWPEAVGAPALRSFDRRGVDHIVWSDSPPFPLVVQCKGFRADEHEIGNSQLKQCLDSIESFQKSRLPAATYLLIHNRDGRNAAFRDAIENALSSLVQSSQVERAELWDRQRLLQQAFNMMLTQVRVAVCLDPDKHRVLELEPQSEETIERVPLRISNLRASQYRLIDETRSIEHISDPAEELLKSRRGSITVLIGEAGYGKTTAAIRSSALKKQRIVYVPAARITATVIGAKDLLAECVDLDNLFAEAADSDIPTFKLLVRPVIEYLLKDEKTPMALVLDGLDESIYFSRRGGIQWLLNQLREVRIPVILIARSEFWHARSEDFKTSFGILARGDQRSYTHLKLIELLPWRDDQILSLSERRQKAISDEVAKARLSKLINIIREGAYEDYYGDIPRRPLFLRFILETVEKKGVNRTGKARLFYQWALMKVTRDVQLPMRWSGVGRQPIVGGCESVDTTVRLSFRAMMLAALQMTTLQEGNVLEILPFCSVEEVLESDELLKKIADPLGLFLNSLLVPIASTLPHKPLDVRFAHRAYQEFFLALYVREHPDRFENTVLPESVREYLGDLQKQFM